MAVGTQQIAFVQFQLDSLELTITTIPSDSEVFLRGVSMVELQSIHTFIVPTTNAGTPKIGHSLFFKFPSAPHHANRVGRHRYDYTITVTYHSEIGSRGGPRTPNHLSNSQAAYLLCLPRKTPPKWGEMAAAVGIEPTTSCLTDRRYYL